MSFMLLLYRDPGAQLAEGEEAALRLPETAPQIVRLNHRGPDAPPLDRSHERLAGFRIVDCETMDEALDIAAEMPEAASGTVEVREMLDLERLYGRR